MIKQHAKMHSLSDKIKECTTLIIQNIQKTIQHKMFSMYLKDRGFQFLVKNYITNSNHGFIKVYFYDHQQALKFYDEQNFISKLLLRPFNIYFDLKIEENQCEKYFLKKVNEKNIRKVFEQTRKYGIVKLSTRYSRDNKHMLDTVVLSYLKYNSEVDNLMSPLAQALEKFNVSIQPFISGNSKIYHQPIPLPWNGPIKPPNNPQFIPPPGFIGLPNIPPSINKSKINVNLPPPKYVSKDDSAQQDQEDSQIENYSIIYYISIYQQNSEQSKRTEQQLKQQMKKIIKRDNAHIFVRTKILPTLEENVRNVVQIRQVSIEDYDEAIRVSSLLLEEIRTDTEKSIVYHYTSQFQNASILNLFDPSSFVVRTTEDKCVILIADKQSKSVKLAEFAFYQQTYFLFDKDKMTFKFMEAKDIKVYGQRQQEVVQMEKDLYLKEIE